MTTTTTFHDDSELKARLLARIRAHEEADAIAQGNFETWNGSPKRCAVGCSLRDLSERGNEPTDWHAEMFRVLGVPIWLARLEDRVFEGLPLDVAKGWPRRFSEALPIGVVLDGLEDRLAIRRLREECLPLAPSWPDSVRDQVSAAIDGVIVVLESNGDWSAARSAGSAADAAWASAGSAARSAGSAADAAWAAWASARSARSAAEAAWASAESAARSARSAAEAAWASWAAWASAESAESARSAAWEREADRIVEELGSSGVREGARCDPA